MPPCLDRSLVDSRRPAPPSSCCRSYWLWWGALAFSLQDQYTSTGRPTTRSRRAPRVTSSRLLRAPAPLPTPSPVVTASPTPTPTADPVPRDVDGTSVRTLLSWLVLPFLPLILVLLARLRSVLSWRSLGRRLRRGTPRERVAGERGCGWSRVAAAWGGRSAPVSPQTSSSPKARLTGRGGPWPSRSPPVCTATQPIRSRRRWPGRTPSKPGCSPLRRSRGGGGGGPPSAGHPHPRGPEVATTINPMTTSAPLAPSWSPRQVAAMRHSTPR